jgi:hypothetical protein
MDTVPGGGKYRLLPIVYQRKSPYTASIKEARFRDEEEKSFPHFTERRMTK